MRSCFGYDDVNRLTHLDHFVDADADRTLGAGESVRGKFAYTFDADGTKASAVETDELGDQTVLNWRYDADGRLIAETRDAPGASGDDYIAVYGHDLVGNRKKYQVDDDPAATDIASFLSATPVFNADRKIAATFNDNDQLVTEGPDANDDAVPDTATTSYTYDANGSTETKTDGGQTIGYQWGLRNRLSGTDANNDGDVADVGDVEYGYDSSGNRISETAHESGGDAVTLFVNDTANPTGYSQVLEEKSSPTAAPTRSHVLGMDVIAQSDADNGLAYLLYDGHGSTRAILDATGNVATSVIVDGSQVTGRQVFAYDAYGNRLQDTISPITPLTNLLYSGEWWDARKASYFLRGRSSYDPATGRFSSIDPRTNYDLGRPIEFHTYLYTPNDPVNFNDPTGMFFDMISLLSSLGIRGMEGGKEGAQAGPALSLARSLNMAMKFYNGVSSAWDTLSMLADFTNLGALSAAERAVFQGALSGVSKLGIHVSLPKITIPIPNSLVKKLQKKVGMLWATPPMQGLLGAACAALITTFLGWETTSIAAGYTGVDAIMKAGKLGFAVVEAKGGSSKLAQTKDGTQMYDKWIRTRIDKALRENLKAADYVQLNSKKNGPLLAAVFSTDLTGSHPEIVFKIQTYPGIKSWGAPFE